MVDKLVWLNNPDIPEIPVMPCVERDTLPPMGPSSTASKALAQVAGAYVLRNPLGVYEWVDSQHDEAGPTFGGVKEIETFKVPAARSSLCSGTGTREGNKGGHKILTDLGWQQHEGMGKKRKVPQADRHLFEDKETSQHGMSNVGKEGEDGQSERLVKAVRPDAPLDMEALQV